MFRLGQFTPQLKLLFNSDRISRWVKGENIYPILIEFDLSNACNHKCNFCNFKYTHNGKILDEKVTFNIVGELARCGIKAINWTGGGEPLMNPAALEIFRFTILRRIQQGIFTNGVLIKDDYYAEYMLSSFNWIRFSIDAGTKETYAAIKHSDDFDKVIEIIKRMVDIRNESHYKTDIGIGFVITNENYHEIEKFSELIKETEVDYGQYKPSIETDLQNNPEWWLKEVKPRLERVFATNDKAVINLYKFNDLTESNIDRPYDICYGHQFCPCIGADGEVWICSQLRNIEGYSFGNIYRDSFRDIWNGAQRRKVIKNVNLTKCPKLCKNNEINKILYRIKHPTNDLHYNFL
jgi:MoaA/NifB/PqqE/SkfB family radical SAM enzyme